MYWLSPYFGGCAIPRFPAMLLQSQHFHQGSVEQGPLPFAPGERIGADAHSAHGRNLQTQMGADAGGTDLWGWLAGRCFIGEAWGHGDWDDVTTLITCGMAKKTSFEVGEYITRDSTNKYGDVVEM